MTLSADSVHWVCGRVDLSLPEPVIDLASVTFFEPFALIYLGMFLRHFATGKRFVLKVPTDTAARNYLTRQNFWQRFNFDPNTLDPALLRRFSTDTSLGDIVDIERRPGIDEEVALAVRNVLERSPLSGTDLELMEEVVAELVSNFARHSRGPLAALAMQWYPQRKTIRLAIGDCGIGIVPA
jgi:hypothetical protein